MSSNAQGSDKQKISENDRFRYIGFEVFRDKPKELFASETEKQKLLEALRSRRASGKVIREDATLLEARVSPFERIVLALACMVMVFSLFLPWYSIYNERVVEETVAAAPAVADSAASSSGEEIITAQQTRKKFIRDYRSETGIGGFAHIGSVFGSGFGLLLTGVLYLVFTLLCLAIPVYILMTIFGTKGNPDDVALLLKQRLQLGWLPLLCFLGGIFLSFLGGSYGFNASAFSSLGTSYGFLPYVGTLSWGVYVALAASLVLAVKSIEI